ncbi:MAG TPA: hypothetical protein VNJ08_10470 [Bacteriovoracaceae bacterium]|nr:hypothetical protein [Bacteriovoracaceae bacterium]
MNELFSLIKKRQKKKTHPFKKFRIAYAITQMELAKQFGCSQTFISYVEKRYKKATPKMWKKFKKLKQEILEQ